MPRLPRIHVPGGFYHVILRGNHRESLFSTADDRFRLNEIVAEALTKYEARIHAFCWMTNHLHALIQIGERPLSKLMQRIQVRYAWYRHKQLNTRGHLFERRHRPLLVEADSYFVTLLRYIHLNPVRAGMVNSVDAYPWSSHRAYLGQESLPWLTTEFGLSLFGRTTQSATRAYRIVMAQACYASEERLLEDTHPDDARVLGGDRFLASLPPLRFKPKSHLTLEQLVNEVCKQYKVAKSRVMSPAKDHDLSPVRVTIARRAVDERIASLGKVARYLGRSTTAMCNLLNRHERKKSENVCTGTDGVRSPLRLAKKATSSQGV